VGEDLQPVKAVLFPGWCFHHLTGLSNYRTGS
jgi:hypothetical protein